MKIGKPICFVLLCLSLLAGCATNEKISEKNGTGEKSWINIIVKEGNWCGITTDKNCDSPCPSLYKEGNDEIKGKCINPVKGEKFESGKHIENDGLTNKNKKEICCICSYEIEIDPGAECPTLYTEKNGQGLKVVGKKSIQPGSNICLYWVKIFKPSECELPKPTEGWDMRLLDDCRVEYINRHGERWIWDPKLWRWTPPSNLPDPNPITPEGIRLADPPCSGKQWTM